MRKLLLFVLYVAIVSKLKAHNPTTYISGNSLQDIESGDSLSKSKKSHQYSKGNLYLQISFPYVNEFRLKPDYESYKSNIGFLGISGGLDYFHKQKQFLNISASGVMNFFLPFPAPVRFGGEREHMFSTFISLSNNHKINCFNLGYGISYTSNTWNFIYHGIPDSSFPPTRDPAYRSNKALGLIFPVHLEFPNGFHTGVIYRPTFFRFSEVQSIAYEHLISLNFGFRIALYRRKQD